MNFFDKSELEDFYGKSYSEISPTDNPDPRYMAGTGTTRCLNCQDVLDVTCVHPSTETSADGFTEFSYCETCEILYKRRREPVIEEINYQYQQYRTDEREEYVCSSCKERHPFTVPETSPDSTDAKGSFTSLEKAKITSFERVTLSCLCGSQIELGNEAVPAEFDCQTCSRTYEMTVTQENS